MTNGKISVAEFDRRFDAGEDMADHVDWSQSRRPHRDKRRVNIDFPAAMLQRLDEEAARRGITRQALIKTWLADRLDHAA